MVYIVLTAKTRSNVRNFRSFETNFLLGETLKMRLNLGLKAILPKWVSPFMPERDRHVRLLKRGEEEGEGEGPIHKKANE